VLAILQAPEPRAWEPTFRAIEFDFAGELIAMAQPPDRSGFRFGNDM
jgi:hypothetical protein